MSQSRQLTTFYIGNQLYGIDVMRVQEVTGNPRIVAVPLAPKFVLGMVNLRGQIATALGLRTLFGHAEVTGAVTGEGSMSVVCHIEGSLVSLVVDSIGEVIEVDDRQFEASPETLPGSARSLLQGIYKLEECLLSVIDLDLLSKQLSPGDETRRIA